MVKNIKFLINSEKHSRLVDQLHILRTIKLLFDLGKKQGNFEDVEKFMSVLDETLQEQIDRTKKDL
ncbi:MAG: hypothetical protein N4A48_03995 [Tepidibacter sp.]|uniref:hypothetical protein n=1 Tax=Tepidibacter sp. TaxID=2529387 RepID=UPI0025DD5A48|nr:hypothetical protein [Tepidibacter sp.]MCT4507911.1 hypothetical protein [Tepidibacter sp.]MCT4606886.1 hypothetical protein [Marinisporobacter sp.]